MPKPFRSLIAGALTAVLMAAPAAQAQDAPDPGTVMATVNGTEITLGHVIALRAELPPQYDQFPAEMLFQGILDQLIQQTLLMQSFEGDPSRQAEILLENERRAVIAGEVIAELVAQDIDEADLQAAYDEQYPANTDELEYHAAHILVETEEEAQALIAELADGADFAELARENSTGPSATVGGDLGWFGEGDMVSEFFDAASALEPGEVSAPLETQFGWHVVKLEETRKRERPDLETVRAELEEQLHTLALTARLEELTEAATIERADPASIDPEAINDRSILED